MMDQIHKHVGGHTCFVSRITKMVPWWSTDIFEQNKILLQSLTEHTTPLSASKFGMDNDNQNWSSEDTSFASISCQMLEIDRDTRNCWMLTVISCRNHSILSGLLVYLRQHGAIQTIRPHAVLARIAESEIQSGHIYFCPFCVVMQNYGF